MTLFFLLNMLPFFVTGSRNKIQSLLNHYTLWMSATDWKFNDDSKRTDGRTHIAHFDMGKLHEKPQAKLMGKPRRARATPSQFKMLLETWATTNATLDVMLDSFKDFIKSSNPNKNKRSAFIRAHPDVWTVEAWSSDAWPMRSNKPLTPAQKRLREEFSDFISVDTIYMTFCSILDDLLSHFL